MALPSAIFFALCLAVLAGMVLLLQRRFLRLRATPEYLLVATFLPLFISSSIVILVPVDLASAASSDDVSRGVVLPTRFLLIAWRIAYWLIFVLTWTILPLLQSFSMSGHRSPQKRFVAALRDNARYHLTVASIGTAGLIYVFITSGVHLISLKSLVMALSYCYSLVLAIYLMGHGLVAVPRGLLKDAGITNKLRRLQHKAPQAYDKLLESTGSLEEVEAEVRLLRQRKNGSAREFQEWIEELAETAQMPEASLASGATGAQNPRAIPTVITEEYLATLTRRLKLCVHRRARFSAEWESLVQAAADCQSILDSSISKRLTFTQHFGSPSLLSKMSILNPYTRHVLHFHILPTARRVLAGLLAVSSACIVWSEIIHIVAPKLSIVSLTIVHHPSAAAGQIGFLGQAIAAIWLSYMCLCAYYSLTVVKVWGTYALVPRLTSAESACFYASYAARLTVPLAYNFITFIPETVMKKTVFFDFLGKLIELTHLGEGFAKWFPIVILFPVAAAMFNLYARVKSLFGFSYLGGLGTDDDEDEGGFSSSGWREGRDLIERELTGVESGGFVRNRAPSARGRGAATVPVHETRRQPRYQDDPQASEEEPDDSEGAFGDFFHRVRNTVDTFEAPRWMKDVQVRRPKWMQGSGDAS